MQKRTLPIGFDVVHAAIKSHLELKLIEQSYGRAMFKVPDLRHLGNCGTLTLRKIDDKKCVLEPSFDLSTDHETLALQERMAVYHAADVGELEIRERYFPADELIEARLARAASLPIWERMLNLWLGISIDDLAPEMCADIRAQQNEASIFLNRSASDADKVQTVIAKFTTARDALIEQKERYQQTFIDRLLNGLRRDGALPPVQVNQHRTPRELIFQGTPVQFASVVQRFDAGRSTYRIDPRNPATQINDVIRDWLERKPIESNQSAFEPEPIPIPDMANVIYVYFDILGRGILRPGTSFGSAFGTVTAQIGPEQTTHLAVEMDDLYPELAELWEALYAELRQRGWVKTPTEVAFFDGPYLPPPARRERVHDVIFDERLEAAADKLIKIIVQHCEGIGDVFTDVIEPVGKRIHWEVSIFGPSEYEGYLTPSWGTVVVWDLGQTTQRVRVIRHYDNELVPGGTHGALIDLVWSLLSAVDGRSRAEVWRDEARRTWAAQTTKPEATIAEPIKAAIMAESQMAQVSGDADIDHGANALPKREQFIVYDANAERVARFLATVLRKSWLKQLSDTETLYANLVKLQEPGSDVWQYRVRLDGKVLRHTSRQASADPDQVLRIDSLIPIEGVLWCEIVQGGKHCKVVIRCEKFFDELIPYLIDEVNELFHTNAIGTRAEARQAALPHIRLAQTVATTVEQSNMLPIRLTLLINTDNQTFAHWLEKHTELWPYQQKMVGGSGVVIDRARATSACDLVILKETWYYADKDGTLVAMPDSEGIRFDVISLNDKRIEVNARCSQTEPTRWQFMELLKDIRRAYPETTQTILKFRTDLLGTQLADLGLNSFEKGMLTYVFLGTPYEFAVLAQGIILKRQNIGSEYGGGGMATPFEVGQELRTERAILFQAGLPARDAGLFVLRYERFQSGKGKGQVIAEVTPGKRESLLTVKLVDEQWAENPHSDGWAMLYAELQSRQLLRDAQAVDQVGDQAATSAVQSPTSVQSVTDVNKSLSSSSPSTVTVTSARKSYTLPDVTRLKAMWDDYNPATARIVVESMIKAYEQFEQGKIDGRWGPRLIAKIAHLDEKTVGRYLKYLKKAGFELGDIPIPTRT